MCVHATNRYEKKNELDTLIKLNRKRGTLVKQEVRAATARRKAQFEEQLATEYCFDSGPAKRRSTNPRMREMQKPISNACFGGPVRCEALECQRCGFCLRHCRCVPVAADRSGAAQGRDQAEQSKLCEGLISRMRMVFSRLPARKTGKAGSERD
jgi:hypothetical protein